MSKIKNEMMALVGACVADKKFLIPENLKDELNKIITAQFEVYTKDESENYDLIIEETPSDLIKIYEKLNENGCYITTPKSLTDRDLFANLSKLFWIVVPYYYIENNEIKPLVFASKKYSPTAEIIRHRSDFVENSFYYTTDVHISAFTLPKHIFEEIKDVIKL